MCRLLKTGSFVAALFAGDPIYGTIGAVPRTTAFVAYGHSHVSSCGILKATNQIACYGSTYEGRESGALSAVAFSAVLSLCFLFSS